MALSPVSKKNNKKSDKTSARTGKSKIHRSMVVTTKVISTTPLQLQSVPKKTAQAFEICQIMNLFSMDLWYLAGGTALALQVGHRQSVDLDFFTSKKTFDEKKVEKMLASSGQWKTTSLDVGTIYGELAGAKMSLIAYPFFLPKKPLLRYGTVSMVSSADIAVMKCMAISQRGRKRDFFDMYWLCHNVRPLYDTLLSVHTQYTIKQNMTHILKSMVYFDDAESDPDPIIYFRASWKTVKSFFRREITGITTRLIR